MALKFGPQWLRDLTDVGAGAGLSQPPPPTSYGVKFKLADYRYGREEMLALYNHNDTPPDQLHKHHIIFSKENLRPISMTPFSEDEQRLMSQGVNSRVVLRGGRGGGISDRGRGRGRGRGDGYISRQNENGDQPFVRQHSNDGWEQVGRKPERSFPRGYDDPAPPKREYLRSSSNNWRDRNQDEEEESSVNWRTTRENTRWSSSRPNWRQPSNDYDETRGPKPRDVDSDLRGPRRISESYDNEVPEWAGDDVGDDPGTFDSKGVFVSTRMGSKENHYQDRGRNEAHGARKRYEKNDETESRESVLKQNPDKSHMTKHHPKSEMNLPVQPPNEPPVTSAQEKFQTRSPSSSSPVEKTDPLHKPGIPLYTTQHSIKGDGDCGVTFTEKDPRIHHDVSGPRQEPVYHQPHALPTESVSNKPETTTNEAEHSDPTDLLHMEKSLQNLLAGLTASADNKPEEEVDVSKGALPLSHKDANKWFYRDPQSKIQGPFSSDSMAEWFRIGYFTMNLIVKRGCDDSFKPLGDLIKQYGRVPFVPGPPLPPLITNTSVPEPVIPADVPATPPAAVMTMPSLVSPMMPGMIGPSSLHDPFMIRSMMLQQEYLKQTLLMQQLQMQTMAKLQEQEGFKDYAPDQQHDIAMRMVVQTNPLLIQQMQQIQHQQVLLQQQQQQHQDLHATPGNLGLDASAGAADPFQHPITHPSMHILPTAPIPSTTLHSTNTTVNDKEAPAPVWAANSQHTENSIWSQPSAMWDVNAATQAHKVQIEKLKREREDEKLKEEDRLQQELQNEIRKQQTELERQREQVRREKEELERERQKKLEEVRREEERLAQLEIDRQKKERLEQEMRRNEEKRRQEEDKKRERELKKQEEKRRKEEEKLVLEEQKRREEARRIKEQEEIRQRQEMQRLMEAKQQEELQRQMELQQIQEEEERMKREAADKEKHDGFKKQQMELQRQQESLRKLQEAQNEQLANIQLPASSNWAKHASQGVGHSKSLTEIQEEEARKERERQREQQTQKERMQEQAIFLSQQQAQNTKSWASQASKGIATRGLSLLDIQQQEKENAKKAEKGKAQNHQAKPSLGSGSNWTGTNTGGGGGLWGTNSTWESGNPAPVSAGGIWDMGVPASVKKPQLGKNSGGLTASQNLAQQQSKKNAKVNKKAAAPAKQKEVESVQKLFQNKKQDGFSDWVTKKLSQFSSDIDVPTFVSFIVEVDSPDDVVDYVKTYLGDNKETQDFSRQFLEKRNQYKNQMRLQKQLEEDSIWGPAPAINPHKPTPPSSDGSKAGNTDGGQGKSKNKKKKKSQKIDGSILGFTVHADSNRKNATGQFETIE